MKLFKSKAGFTLIELLVVIGILAVLAAIAIPSVAGLIDRANVSADKTNANEMTNAIERFTSEYELYCQDIASGVIDANTTDFDAAQGRVYNVTQVKTRSEIETLEVAQGANVPETQLAIYRDTKYPVNAVTLKAIVENYTKTSSATFEPKQSDMHYWYSPDCGIVVYADATANKGTLNALIQSGKDAKGNNLTGSTQWIDITLDTSESAGSGAIVGNAIPDGATYYDASIGSTLQSGEPFPMQCETGDIFIFGDYEYRYNYYWDGDSREWYLFEDWWYYTTPSNGWGMAYMGRDVAQPTAPVQSINNESITCASYAFFKMQNLEKAPTLPNTIENMAYTFSGCVKLKQASAVPTSTVEMPYCFFECVELQSPPSLSRCAKLNNADGAFQGSGIKTLPQMPDNVASIYSMFMDCKNLEDASGFDIPTGTTDLYSLFQGCTNLKYAPEIPTHVEGLMSTFENCSSLQGTVVINGQIGEYEDAFKNVDMSKITLAGDCPNETKQLLANSGKNPSQVTIV